MNLSRVDLLTRGSGLLYEVRCKPITAVVGVGEARWEVGDGPGRDWAVWISGDDFGMRADIIQDAVIRFPLDERRRHFLLPWVEVLLIEELDEGVLKLSGNFGIGINQSISIAEARRWLKHGYSARRLIRPDMTTILWNWMERQRQDLVALVARGEEVIYQDDDSVFVREKRST